MIEISKAPPNPYHEDPPLTWRYLKWSEHGGSLGEKTIQHVSATFHCPKGHIGTLAHHQIKDDGTVEPSVVCTGYPPDNITCDFHEHVRLVGWNPAETQ